MWASKMVSHKRRVIARHAFIENHPQTPQRVCAVPWHSGKRDDRTRRICPFDAGGERFEGRRVFSQPINAFTAVRASLWLFGSRSTQKPDRCSDGLYLQTKGVSKRSFEHSLEMKTRRKDVLRLLRTGRYSTPMLAAEGFAGALRQHEQIHRARAPLSCTMVVLEAVKD